MEKKKIVSLFLALMFSLSLFTGVASAACNPTLKNYSTHAIIGAVNTYYSECRMSDYSSGLESGHTAQPRTKLVDYKGRNVNNTLGWSNGDYKKLDVPWGTQGMTHATGWFEVQCKNCSEVSGEEEETSKWPVASRISR